MTQFKRKLIGRGTFTKAFQISETEVEVITTCPSKECYAIFSQGNPFAPVIEKTDYLDSGESVYLMPFYSKVKSPSRELNKESLEVYEALRAINNTYSVKDYYEFCNAIDATTLPEEAKENIKELCGDVANGIDCYDLGFEISPRNIAISEGGQLIMLDCFFSRKLLTNTNKR